MVDEIKSKVRQLDTVKDFIDFCNKQHDYDNEGFLLSGDGLSGIQFNTLDELKFILDKIVLASHSYTCYPDFRIEPIFYTGYEFCYCEFSENNDDSDFKWHTTIIK